MVRIKWLKSAQSDLQEIHDYISYKPERPYTFKIHLLDLLKNFANKNPLIHRFIVY